MLHKIVVAVVLVVFSSQFGYAQTPMSFPGLTGTGSEYFVGRIEGKPLITVNLISGVHVPGVYHIPIQTNLAQLFSFAGGKSDYSDISEITIRSTNGTSVLTREVDLEKVLARGDVIPVLQERDVISVKDKSQLLEKSLTYVALISGILSAVLSAIAINKSK